MGLWSNLLGKLVDEMVMYMEANEGKLRRDEGIPDEKVMAFDPRDLLPSDIALEMEWRRQRWLLGRQ